MGVTEFLLKLIVTLRCSALVKTVTVRTGVQLALQVLTSESRGVGRGNGTCPVPGDPPPPPHILIKSRSKSENGKQAPKDLDPPKQVPSPMCFLELDAMWGFVSNISTHTKTHVKPTQAHSHFPFLPKKKTEKNMKQIRYMPNNYLC